MLPKIARVIMTCACAGLFGGCSADWLLNHEADEKSNADNTLKPSPFGIIGETPIRNQRPAVGDGSASDRTKDVVTEPVYQDITITDDNLPKTGSSDGLSRIEEKSGAGFAAVFPDRNPNDRLGSTRENLNIMTIVARFGSDMKFNYTVESGVSGTVTMSLHAEFSAAEAWDMFNRLLWMCKAYCDFRDGVLYIRPLDQVAREQQILDEGSSVMLRTVRMKYVPAANIMEQLKPFLSSESTCKGWAEQFRAADRIRQHHGLEIITELDKNYKQGDAGGDAVQSGVVTQDRRGIEADYAGSGFFRHRRRQCGQSTWRDSSGEPGPAAGADCLGQRDRAAGRASQLGQRAEPHRRGGEKQRLYLPGGQWRRRTAAG